MIYTLIAKEWYDRINGNSYFSARIMDGSGTVIATLPFQYGYGSQFEHEAKQVMVGMGLVDSSLFPREIFNTMHKHDRCLKRDVMVWGECKS